MTITSRHLYRAAGLCTLAAGAIFVGVQINHPPLNLETVNSAEWVVRSVAKALMAALALAGVAGLYLWQRRKVGVLGLVGALLFGLGYLTMFFVEMLAGFALPALTGSSPGFVSDVLSVATGGRAQGDIGLLPVIFNISGLGYLAGGLILGIAMFRAKVVARWAAALLAVGTLATAALAVLPESFNRPLAIPTGVALIGLGWSLWRQTRAGDDQARSRQAEPAMTR